MKPVEFPERNITLVKEGCGDLPAFRGEGVFASCWELDAEDMQILIETKKVWLVSYSNGHPPVELRVDYPFNDKSDYPEILGG